MSSDSTWNISERFPEKTNKTIKYGTDYRDILQRMIPFKRPDMVSTKVFSHNIKYPLLNKQQSNLKFREKIF